MNDLCTDISYCSLAKYGEPVCGDHIELCSAKGSQVLVLADGLGSGIKASILATLTAKIIATMTASSMGIQDCVATIASTLPVCKVRGIAYSTFSIIKVNDCKTAEIIQFDNPAVIMLRHGEPFDFGGYSTIIGGKKILISEVALEEGDLFVAVSDGAVYAGAGRKLNFGWQHENIKEFLKRINDESFTAKTIAALLLSECARLYEDKPGDDTTAAAILIKKRRQVNLLIGPPEDPSDTDKMLSLFFSKEGDHIVCGGTTSMLTAKYLHKELVPLIEYAAPDIPPCAAIEGVDLVTEGVITINKVVENGRSYMNDGKSFSDFKFARDGASKISEMLFEQATDINFFVGRAINPAHQNPKLPIRFSIKMQLIDELANCLQTMGKKIKVSYF